MNPDGEHAPDQPAGTPTTLKSLWSANTTNLGELDAECSPTKTCRNMKDVTFDGYAEDGVDIRSAWRNTLEREGKLGPTTLGELINRGDH